MIDALEIFRALADSSRLRILRLLRTMELSVGELAQVLGQSQPRVSRHVKILCDAGLAERRKEGSWVFVALGPAEAVAPVAAALDGWEAAAPDRQAAADVARLAEEQVEAAMLAALGDAPVGRLIDIGTGTGRMIELFAPRAHTALGIDRSSEMLRLARAKLGEQGLANVELRQADLYALPMGDGEADVAIIHHVLHFAQQPGAAIVEAARVLAPGGRLLIADFAPHDREELRAQDAHTRLGFSDAQIERWFAAAGLTLAKVETLAGGELTVKLWLGVRQGAALREVKAA
ncbi:MAG: metalloregulator ArsR/SmtB family transcription factor [Sphingomonas sp.]|uniref:ArsR/SmtB family transcription factor n=1 Tax=Sphingomonas sp. TaxID=28214 RepID=UPI001AD09A6B|nr:metalloregulator ArsR/SmtB family transcription factor [Sphingomonas sp.]MBN8848461.1 metalloregulator ArsR/SmtB family transcription factor [Sphingomonas sp.]